MSYYYLEEHYIINNPKKYLILENEKLDGERVEEFLTRVLETEEVLNFSFNKELTEKQVDKIMQLDLMAVKGSNNYVVSKKLYDVFYEELNGLVLFHKAVIHITSSSVNAYYMEIKKNHFNLCDPIKTVWKYSNYANRYSSYMPIYYSPYYLDKLYKDNPGIMMWYSDYGFGHYVNEKFYQIAKKNKLKVRMKYILKIGSTFSKGCTANSRDTFCGFMIIDELKNQGFRDSDFIEKEYGNFLDDYHIDILESEQNWKGSPAACKKLVLHLKRKKNKEGINSIDDGKLYFYNIEFLEKNHCPSFEAVVNKEAKLIHFGISLYKKKMIMASLIKDIEDNRTYTKQQLFEYELCEVEDCATKKVYNIENDYWVRYN